MATPNFLKMTCDRCKVSEKCPQKGSSPLIKDGKRTTAMCSLIGGYGREPVDEEILSEDSLRESQTKGRCLTLASIPRFDPESNSIQYDLVKIFSEANLHPREKTDFSQDMIYPKAHNLSGVPRLSREEC